MLRSVSIALALLAVAAQACAQETYDVVIYTATAAGISAAVQAARMGKKPIVIEPGRHLGGMTSGGLGATDIGNKQAIGGISREFYQRVLRYYADEKAWRFQQAVDYQSQRQKPGDDAMWTFEPHVAEAILQAMLDEAKVPVRFGQRLDRENGVEGDDEGKIVSIQTESGAIYQGRMFIDASYEGDLMAAVGVSYHVGRESNATYGETLNGVQLGSIQHQFKVDVDPYVTPGVPQSGLLPGVHAGGPGAHGQGDARVQAYNFRMCLTDVPENRAPFPKPAGYDPKRYELSLRTMLAGQWDGFNAVAMPNRKTDTNNQGAFSTDNIGANYDYPDADYATRERIWEDHVKYQLGWMWFLANDPRVPRKIQDEINRWGLAKDEFVDTAHWPHQLYVREARRMVSDYVMTEQHCLGKAVAPDPVGLGAYNMDSHNTQRWVDQGHARNEGDVQVRSPKPYGVSYRSIVSKAEECSNLLVPVCLSASHIAYGSIRMEPVFMVLGQSAATAACQAIDAKKPVQAIDYAPLRARLLADGQILE